MVHPTQPLLRQLGKDGPFIPALGFGLMGMSLAYGPTESDENRLRLLDRAWELGCTNWDTADAYGDNEDILGKWFELHPERRKDIFLASKFGLKTSADGITVDSSPSYCEECIEKSLRRLKVNYIDLYYLHRPNPEVPIEETLQAMKRLVSEGKVKYLGLSEISSRTLRRAHAIYPISAVQVEYNLWTLDIEGPSGTYLLDTCKELGISIFAYSPLGRGIMTGTYRSASDFGPGDSRAGTARFREENLKSNLHLVDKLGELARRKNCTSGQLVLAWLLAQGENVLVVPGTKKTKYLEENFNASSVVITAHEELELRRLVSEIGVNGGRDATYGSYIDTVPLDG
ncbi:Aldo/keto reductase [Xylaria longipes]|nr:Aldo/keto reductase [Xylaria longipes]RYC65225.1 hypothetical protein CHU98_g976 [Xylaria longipes]